MCGICGIVNFNGESVEVESIRKMMDLMINRGPDDSGIYIDGNIGLGHRRLSIIDLSKESRQPMSDKWGKYVIVYNGEIYNYLELKKEYLNEYEFQTKSDTEVILYAYHKWGENCLDYLNGMFAFAIFDTIERKVFIARDRFGIKPFYYYVDNEKFIFASDIPPILSVLGTKIEANNQIIYDYLLFNRTNHNENTFFKNIKKLQHSHKMTINNRNLKIESWYNLRDKIKNPYNSAIEFKEGFQDSIRLQLRSDVPVGACLSGGLDSSSIVSVITKCFSKNDLHTFSAVYNEKFSGNEMEYILEYQDIIDRIHFSHPTADSLFMDLDNFVETLVEPVPNTSEYAEYKVMELAKQYCTVILNGQGADEQLAGYYYFAGYYYHELFNQLHLLRLIKEVYFDLSIHRSFEGLLSSIFFSLSPNLQNRLFSKISTEFDKDFLQSYIASPEITGSLYNAKGLQDAFINHFEHKFEHHLLWADKSGMRFSLETRFPFLDHNLVEKVLAFNPTELIKNGWNKWVLRESMTGILPEKIRLRKNKVGFSTPENHWFKTPKWQELFNDTINSTSFKNRSYFNFESITAKHNKKLNGNEKISPIFWKAIHIEKWFKKFIDN